MANRRNVILRLGGLAVAVLAVCAFAGGEARAAQEVIETFVSDIAVEADGDLLVRETITVHAAGYQIKRGIYRDFPTIYRGAWGLKEKVGFDVIEVTRDGNPEPFFTDSAENGVRVYIGDEGVFLSEGDYTYVIVYQTDRQLRFDDGYDELYWNVTGNGWAFPILRAEARVHLPEGAQPIERAAYTGAFGETGKNFKSTVAADGTVIFATTRPLEPYEGLTIAISWPKGFVAEPTGLRRAGDAVMDNIGVVVGVIGLVLTVIYFLVFWNRIGRDPDKGVVIPLFSAPKDMPPVVVGYTANWGFGSGFAQSRAFAVALTSMATKGAVTIEADEDDSFTVSRTGDVPDTLSRGERTVHDNLFLHGSGSVTMSRTYNPVISRTVDLLSNLIRKDYTDVYFRLNRGIWFGGAALAIAGGAVAAMLDADSVDDIFTVGVLSVFGLGFGFAAANLWVRLMSAVRHSSLKWLALAGGIVVAAMFSAPSVAAASLATVLISVPVMAIMVLDGIVIVVFWFLLKAPTMQGRKVMDEIEGYKLYLSVAEADRMNMLGTEPVMSLELFERHLPYAMALGVEKPWTRHFEAQIPPDQLAQSGGGPRWYSSHGGVSSLSSMASNLSSGMAGTISSAATRPSSSGSGGSSGGGSSGGGGGGGGGGGW
jgi:hypothetical protein